MWIIKQEHYLTVKLLSGCRMPDISVIVISTDCKTEADFFNIVCRNSLAGQERYQIGKYASENGNTAAVRHFKGNNLNEGTVREYKKTYQIELKNAKIQKRSPRKSLHIAVQGRPKKMQALDEKVQNFLLVARGRGSIIKTATAIATATGFMQNSNDEYYSTVTLGRPWAQSLFRRMGFVRRFAKTGKVEIPEGAKREAELLFINQIVSNIE